jgi:hypothetical protein
MSRFYGSMQGNRSETTRQGSKNSGIEAHIRGWDIGIEVRCYVDDYDKDVCVVNLTGGSNNPTIIKRIGTFRENKE